jgi:tetratricopeptide (TPR) repeat protein
LKQTGTYISVVLLFIFSFIRTEAQIDLDSVKQVLAQSKTDSLTLLEYVRTVDRLSSDKNEARFLIADWLLEQTTKKKWDHIKAKTYHSLGIIYMKAKDQTRGAEYFNKALAIAESRHYYDIAFRILNSMGVMYYGFKQKDKAVACYEKAIELGKKSRDSLRLGVTYGNLASVLMEHGYNDKAIQLKSLALILKGLALTRRSTDTAGMINLNNNLSYIYVDLQKNDSALLVLKENELLIRKFGTEEDLVTHYLRIGQVCSAKKQYREALKNYERGLQLAKKYKLPTWQYNYYLTMADAYEGLGDYKKANTYNKLYIDVHDSIATVENFMAAEEVQNRYQQEKKQKEILRLNKDNEIKALQLEKESGIRNRLLIIIVSVVPVAVLLIVLIIFLVRVNTERKKAYHKLQEKNIEIQAQAEKLSEQSRLISRFQSQMNPHFVFNALNSIQGFVINDQKEKTILQLQRMSYLMRETLNNSEKETIPLEKEISYLRSYVDFEQEKFRHPIRFSTAVPENADELLIPPMLIQPFIENAIRHAGFHQVQEPTIQLVIRVVNDLLEIRIIDNGKGMDTANNNPVKDSHAIAMIYKRLHMLLDNSKLPAGEKQLEIVSKPVIANGTAIRFYIPLIYQY